MSSSRRQHVENGCSLAHDHVTRRFLAIHSPLGPWHGDGLHRMIRGKGRTGRPCCPAARSRACMLSLLIAVALCLLVPWLPVLLCRRLPRRPPPPLLEEEL